MKEIVALASEQNKGMITALGRVSGIRGTIEVLREGVAPQWLSERIYVTLEISQARQEVV